MLDLAKCPTCDAWFEVASLDAAVFHRFGRCIDLDAEPTESGIRGELVEEPPQG
jgi:hypothetical protein